MGINRNLSPIQNQFHLPGLTTDVKIRCKSCTQCQTTRMEGKFPKAKLQVTDIPARPFKKVAIDIIGPMRVPSHRGSLYIITMADLCTRWPQAIPLRSIPSYSVTETLNFSRLCFLNTILSYNGSQFVSHATKLINL